MTSTRKIIQFPERRKFFRPDETAFLPAALEIVETPASPTARMMGAAIIALLGAALAWAWLGSVDIVAIAPGKIVASGRTKIIQPIEAGVIRAIHIRDGSTVKAGDVLIELDPTISAAELKHMRIDLAAAELDAARLRAILADSDDLLKGFTPPDGTPGDLIETQRQLLATQALEHHAKIGEIDRQIAQKQAERDTLTASVAKLEATTPLLEERANLREYLYESKLGSKITYLADLQDLVGQQHEILVQKSRGSEADAAIATLGETRSRVNAEFRRALFDDLTKAEQKIAGLAQDVVKAEQKARQQILTAPIDGVVQQLAVHTVGGVVTPAQALAVVVATNDGVEIEAMVSNRDIGFVSAGQAAEIKIDTFNFTRYGLIRGHIIDVSRDAISPERPREPPQQPENASGEPGYPEPSYAARIALDRTRIQIDDRLMSLSPGMSVTAEIKTGSRRIISYLLSPLARYRHDVLRER
jgi:hemolysin D